MPSPARPVTIEDVTEAFQQRGRNITTHMVIMQDDTKRPFALPVGPCEALGIRLWLRNEFVQRPITHDMIKNVIGALACKIEQVTLEKVEDNWQARLSLKTPQGPKTLYAQCGDGIAVALRTNSPIYATEEVITSCKYSA